MERLGQRWNLLKIGPLGGTNADLVQVRADWDSLQAILDPDGCDLVAADGVADLGHLTSPEHFVVRHMLLCKRRGLSHHILHQPEES